MINKYGEKITQWNIKMPEKLKKDVKNYCKKNKIPISKLMRKLLIEYMKSGIINKEIIDY